MQISCQNGILLSDREKMSGFAGASKIAKNHVSFMSTEEIMKASGFAKLFLSQKKYMESFRDIVPPRLDFWNSNESNGRTTLAVALGISMMTSRSNLKVIFTLPGQQDMINLLRIASSMAEKTGMFRDNSIYDYTMHLWNNSELRCVANCKNLPGDFKSDACKVVLHVVDNPVVPIEKLQSPSVAVPWVGLRDTLVIGISK